MVHVAGILGLERGKPRRHKVECLVTRFSFVRPFVIGRQVFAVFGLAVDSEADFDLGVLVVFVGTLDIRVNFKLGLQNHFELHALETPTFTPLDYAFLVFVEPQVWAVLVKIVASLVGFAVSVPFDTAVLVPGVRFKLSFVDFSPRNFVVGEVVCSDLCFIGYLLFLPILLF